MGRELGVVFIGPKGASFRRSNFRRIWNAAYAEVGIPGLDRDEAIAKALGGFMQQVRAGPLGDARGQT